MKVCWLYSQNKCNLLPSLIVIRATVEATGSTVWGIVGEFLWWGFMVTTE